MEIKTRILDLRTGDECFLQVRAGAQVTSPDLDGRIAAARFMMAILDYFEQVALEFEGYTFAKIIYINHYIASSGFGFKRRDYTAIS
jgi:hypothetical protein